MCLINFNEISDIVPEREKIKPIIDSGRCFRELSSRNYLDAF